MDHINAPAMWDVRLRAKFDFRYQEVTTLTPYLNETLDQPPILLTCFHQNVTRGATTALGSMAFNAQAVFRVLAEAQLDDPDAPGITLPTLFRMCRERWLVSSEQALRGFLAEFYDHELVSQRVGGDEQREVLYVPMDQEALRKLLATLTVSCRNGRGGGGGGAAAKEGAAA
jgi:origin recognition complex subunit 2